MLFLAFPVGVLAPRNSSRCMHSGSQLNGKGGLKYRSLVEKYFANDFLAPVVASLFGPGPSLFSVGSSN